MAFTARKILIIHSQQPANQFAGGASGVNDSEQFWMRKLADEIYTEVKKTGHDVRLGPVGTASSTFHTNVAWVNKAAQADADLLITAHSNAGGTKSTGIGVYYSSTKGKAFAVKLAPYLKKVSAANKAYVSKISVSETVDTKPPAILVEHEYHDWAGSATTGGAEWLRTAANRTKIAKAYRDFVVDMWGQKPTAVVYPTEKTLQGRIIAYRELGRTYELNTALSQYDARGSHWDSPRWAEFVKSWNVLDAPLTFAYTTPLIGIPNSPAHAFVMLGSGLAAGGKMSTKHLRRLKLVLSAAKRYTNTRIIISGGAPVNGVTEGALGAKWLIENGIVADRIIAETQSASTVGNARYSMKILTDPARKFTSYTLVSDASHLRRAATLFDAALLQIETGDNVRRTLSRLGFLAFKDVENSEAKPSAAQKAYNSYNVAILLGILDYYTKAKA